MKNYEKDKLYMLRALELAKKGEGRVSPNPMVGAVVVKNDKIIGEGYHHRCGEYHAERNALLNCTETPCGATIYVTLEPCCHYGKTPPCTEIIIESKIARVVVGVIDDNDLVGGKGIEILRDAGIEVVTGVLEKECRDLNKVFFHYIKNKQPYVVMKYAMTMDGKIATYTGSSKWITSEEARENVHRTRSKYKGIMVGIGTVLKDDPMLNCRLEDGVNPVRIVVDSHLSIPLDSNIVKSANYIDTIIATVSRDTEKIKTLEENKIKVIVTREKEKKVDLKALFNELGKLQIDSVLVEGGGTLNWSIIKDRLVNEIHTYLGPKLVGGKEAIGPVGGKGIEEMGEAIKVKINNVTKFGEDILIESEVEYPCLQE